MRLLTFEQQNRFFAILSSQMGSKALPRLITQCSLGLLPPSSRTAGGGIRPRPGVGAVAQNDSLSWLFLCLLSGFVRQMQRDHKALPFQTPKHNNHPRKPQACHPEHVVRGARGACARGACAIPFGRDRPGRPRRICSVVQRLINISVIQMTCFYANEMGTAPTALPIVSPTTLSTPFLPSHIKSRHFSPILSLLPIDKTACYHL